MIFFEINGGLESVKRLNGIAKKNKKEFHDTNKKDVEMKSKKQLGFTIVELMITIVFISGLVAVVFIQAQKLMANKRSDSEAQHIMGINNAINSGYKTARSYQTVSNSWLINSKNLPDDMQLAGTQISNAWGGTVTIAPDAGANNLRYQITYTGVPRLECSKMATSVGVNFERLDINGTAIFDRGTNGANLDIDPAAIATQCVDGSVNVLIFTNR